MMNRPYNQRPFRARGTGRGFGRGHGNYRGRGGLQETLQEHFINISADGCSLRYSRLGTENFGDPSLVKQVIESRKVVGEYSEDSERNFVNDRSYLHFLQTKYLPDDTTKEKVVEIDLKVSETEGQAYTSTGSKDLENFVTWIINNEDTFKREIDSAAKSKEGGKFVMQKSVLGNLVAAPYRFNCEIKFYAYSFNGVIYFQKEYTPFSNHPNDQHGLWVHKFEQYMTEEDTSKGAMGNETFRVVLTSNLGPHKLLYSSTLDCANPEEFEGDFNDLSAFINLKCLEKVDSFNYRFQMMYWYMHYVLAGIPKTLLGQRDSNGVVTMLKLYDMNDMLLAGKQYWNPVNCLFFASKVLSFIKNKVESEPGSVFCIRKVSKVAEFTCTKETEIESFLPEWFIQDILESKASGDVDDDDEGRVNEDDNGAKKHSDIDSNDAGKDRSEN